MNKLIFVYILILVLLDLNKFELFEDIYFQKFNIFVLILKIILLLLIIYTFINSKFRQIISLNIFVIILCFLIFESYLVYFFDDSEKKQISKLEFLQTLKNSHERVYPNYLPYLAIQSNGIKLLNNKIFPLSGISNSVTIFDNEQGFFPVINTDNYGFHNLLEYEIDENVDILLLGDSYTEGYSVNSNENIAYFLSQNFKQVINLGKSGNGPLIELATLSEYGAFFKPKYILWLYCQNDIVNLRNELESSTLRKYLFKESFSQDLIKRQSEIDQAITKFINLEQNSITIKIIKFINFNKTTNIIKRKYLNFTTTKEDLILFKEILEKSNNKVKNWNGKLYFVYLPTIHRYLNDNEHYLLKDVKRIVKNLNIPFIDIHEEVFLKVDDPMIFIPPGGINHYNKNGYKFTSEAIKNNLN